MGVSEEFSLLNDRDRCSTFTQRRAGRGRLWAVGTRRGVPLIGPIGYRIAADRRIDRSTLAQGGSGRTRARHAYNLMPFPMATLRMALK